MREEIGYYDERVREEIVSEWRRRLGFQGERSRWERMRVCFVRGICFDEREIKKRF